MGAIMIILRFGENKVPVPMDREAVMSVLSRYSYQQGSDSDTATILAHSSNDPEARSELTGIDECEVLYFNQPTGDRIDQVFEELILSAGAVGVGNHHHCTLISSLEQVPTLPDDLRDDWELV
ncbi:hypothetical protein [Rhodococcus sp. NPDC060176]|uniref:hypothetical protein n=1 Tax=Rhodococcus sp. NPDC060176 TaxID=3347062 RepID=UPI0036683A3B